jgi:hypothetical protein
VKLARLKVVESSGWPQMKSLRGPKGRGRNDPAHAHITAAGFEDGDDVVLILASDYERLTNGGK